MKPTTPHIVAALLASLTISAVLTISERATADASAPGHWSTNFGPTGFCSMGKVTSAVTVGGDLIVAGSFMDSARDSLRYIARWDGERLRSFGNNLQGIECLAVRGDQLYAGGRFRLGAGPGTVGLVRWDGKSWQPTSPSLSGEVFALTGYQGALVAGGRFTIDGDDKIRHLALWDGRKWQPLADGVAGGGRTRVLAVAAYGDGLAAGGIFTQAGGTAARNVAVWDGKNWSACGAGTDDAVQALCSANGELYAGGRFRTAGADSASCIAAWDGRRWSALGAGLRGNPWQIPSVSALTSWSGGVVAGGSFVGAGDAVVGGIATWDGSTWQPMPPGSTGADRISPQWEVRALTTWRGMLAAGGDMKSAPGSTINGLGLWDGTRWTPLGAGQGVSGFQDLRLLAGSVFLESGGIAGPENVSGTAVWSERGWRPYAIPTDTGLSFDITPKSMAERDGRLVALGRLRDGPPTSMCDVNPFPWHMAELRGDRWQVLSPALPRDKVDCKALLPLGSQLYVLGEFASEGSITEGAMIWDGRKWRTGGLDLDGGNIISAVVAGGRIVVVIGHYRFKRGETSSFSIVEGDGESWRTIRDSTGFAITALGCWESKLVAAFERPFPAVTEPGILEVWDGHSWSPLPGEFSSMYAGGGRIQALAVHQGHLVAAGDFRGVDGRVASNIAFLADGVWRPLNGGVDVWVSRLVSSGDGLWLGGSFSHASGALSLAVARW